ncbi:MAG: c-type cytochrome biogenesis protein CcmI [Gammaproteobacteria bacterium]
MISSFLFAALVLLIIALTLIFWPLFKASNLESKASAKDNVAIFKERLAELNEEKKQGYLEASAFQHLKLELEKSLLNDVENQPGREPAVTVRQNRHWLMAGFLSVLVLVGSTYLYLKLGRSDDYMRYLVLQEQAAESEKKLSDFKTMITQLSAKLSEQPEALPKWYLLAKSYLALGEYDKAADTFYRMTRFIPQDHADYAAIKGHYAQALFLAAGETITPAVTAAVESALALDPEESSALTLKGVQAYDQREYRQAIDYWRRAERKASPDQIERFLEPAIASATEELGGAPETTPQVSKLAVTPAASIPVRLNLDPALKARVPNDQPVFVFAREEGGKMPLAVVKLKAGELPATIVLDDSKAVMSTGKLSNASRVTITARISFSGQAIEQPGDFYGEVKAVPVEKRTAPLELVIAREVE